VFDTDDPNSFYQVGISSENLKNSPILFGIPDKNKEEDEEVVCLEKYFIEEDDRLDSQ